jgi:hypothetical protein
MYFTLGSLSSSLDSFSLMEFHPSKTTDITFLCPNVIDVAGTGSLGCVDALAERIDTDSITAIADACIAFDG